MNQGTRFWAMLKNQLFFGNGCIEEFVRIRLSWEMHEAGIMRQILEIAAVEARKAGSERVRCIRIRVGNLAGVVPEALRFAFDAMAKGTVAEGGGMEIEMVSASCRCEGCNETFEPADFIFECPSCHSLDVEILRGRELELSQLEVT